MSELNEFDSQLVLAEIDGELRALIPMRQKFIRCTRKFAEVNKLKVVTEK